MNHNEIGVLVFRQLAKDVPSDPWDDQGFTLERGTDSQLIQYQPVDLLSDRDNGLIVYLFDTREQCVAFQAGLEAAGEDVTLSAIGTTNLGCPGVIRELVNFEAYEEACDDPNDEGRVLVVDHRQEAHESTVTVRHWDCPRYGGADQAVDGPDYFMTLSDRRLKGGQIHLSIDAKPSPSEDGLSLTAEVNSLPGTQTPVPCFHVSVGDYPLFSVFQIGPNDVFFRLDVQRLRMAPEFMGPDSGYRICCEEGE